MWKPNAVRSSNHQVMTAVSSARKKPRCSWVPSTRGKVAFQSTIGAIGSLRPGIWNAVVVSSQARMPLAM